MHITLRNPERRDWMSGWGVINRALAPMCDSIDKRDEYIHLFLSPPYSFLNLDPSKFNVGVTMGERHDVKSYKFDFVGLCNQMDLLIVPGTWQKQVFKLGGITTPIEVVPLGHDDAKWHAPLRRKPKNTSALILDRGRDRKDGRNALWEHFDEVTYMNCRTPSPDGKGGNTNIIKQGRYGMEQIKAAYKDHDVLFKWGREGWCFPILEAMSAHCLVITNCHTLPYLEKGKNCLIFRTVEEMQDALKRASNKELEQIKIAGKKTAQSLTWDKAKSEIRKVIKSYL